ncbi:MAG: hypothetical protein EHM78_11730 [Myxococcaceae bacterium]|nr:MAG: hypothetical protein EHM78_11730 [Myxococcaceae bacterium]
MLTVLSIILVVVGIQASDWFTKRQELEATKVKLEATAAELEHQRAENKAARGRIGKLESNVRALTATQPSPPPTMRPSRSP